MPRANLAIPRKAQGETKTAFRARMRQWAIARYGQDTLPGAARTRAIQIQGQDYVLTADDALSIVGALALAVDGQTARVTLASGDTLELTHEEVSDLGRQLAGKPADAVSGSNPQA